MLLILLTIIATLGTTMGGVGSFLYWRESHTDRGKTRDENRIKHALAPLKTDLQLLHAKLDADDVHSAVVVRAAIHDALEPIRDQLAILNTKVEPLWTALINMGINQTNVLHQPDPRRAEVDGLLEALQAELRGGKLMTTGQYDRMRHFLELIKTWEPGEELGFPVLPAEPTSAAILLAIMGLSRERRRQETPPS